MKYLYGASVQGIQGFIFQTSKLSEIVGASELVEQICTDLFKEEVEAFDEQNLILAAAGNIKYLFEDEAACQKLVRKFPKRVMELAPGITISQAVVKVEAGKDSINELEKRLKVQRNKPVSITSGVGLMVTETARRTGGIGFEWYKDAVIDKAQFVKHKAADKANRKLIEKLTEKSGKYYDQFPFDISEMVGGEKNKSWIAVIHADGNNLGNRIIEMSKSLEGRSSMQALKSFSIILNTTTVEAARNTFNAVVLKDAKKATQNKLPFRPVILGGDDLTAIIRADLAVDFTNTYLEEFERLSNINFKNFGTNNNIAINPFENGLTACAGIAFIKASYPFHYGVSLAEKLCQEAKKTSKNLDEVHSPSSIMFHKVHASFVEDYTDIINTELKAANNIHFNYGPYFLHPREKFLTVSELKNLLAIVNRKDAPKAGLRNWLTALKHNPENADQTLQRIASLTNKFYARELFLKSPFTTRNITSNKAEEQEKFTPIFDVISLSNLL